ncbi:hypothetical protein [Klebsiella variicola]|uniref:hypothetical protein n=1 Tax=Klebsiella variicola TaxID=244366 RepID=UPI0034DF3D7B
MHQRSIAGYPRQWARWWIVNCTVCKPCSGQPGKHPTQIGWISSIPGISDSCADGEIPAEEIEVRDAVKQFKVTGDQALSMNPSPAVYEMGKHVEQLVWLKNDGATNR